MTRKKDTYNYRGWLVSDNFLKRLLAFAGYLTIIYLILAFLYFSLLPIIFELFGIPV